MAEIFNFYVQDSRTIQFPKNNLLEPIMQEDHNVAVWRFRIPKVLNAIDMSGYAWWFVYVNAKGQEFSELLTLVDDIDEPDSYCTADYSINYGVSYHPGSFQFSLEAINADSGGEVLNEWHTKTYAHKVDKTLQGNQVQWSETESDIISALIVEVQNKVAQLVGGATPEPKSLIADMTDTKKVYLYVGSETGESTNYWYYYNGSAWVAGGLYAGGITVDSTPTQGSTNAVQSGGVKSALDAVTAQIPAIDPTLTQSGQAADSKVVGDEISVQYFSPETSPGYWSVDGVHSTASSPQQEVVTEWFTRLGNKIVYKLTYPEAHDTWICLLYEFTDSTKQRVIVETGNGTNFSGAVAIPANVARLSLSYRTYGDCTFAISGVFRALTGAEKEKIADSITADDVQRFECKYTPIESMELVETIVTSANSRSNWSNATLDGFYAVIPEMASEDYTYILTVNPNKYRYLLNYRSNVIYINNAKLNFYISPSAYAGHKLHIYKLSEGDVLTLSASTVTKLYPLTLAVDNYYPYMRTNSLDVLPASNMRISSDVFNYHGKFKINLSDTENYKVAIQSFDRTSRTKVEDTGWKTDGYEFYVPMHCCFIAVLAKTDDGRISIDDIPEGLLSIEAVGYASITEVSHADIELLNAKVDAIPTQELLSLSDAVDANKIQALVNLRNTSPVYDHLFVNDTVNAKIPHESLYHIRLSRALGYKIIEANTRATSDGVIIVNHLSNGKFGDYFHHVDGVTDISNIDVNTVTWDWVVNNVRYNSSTPKYRTRPVRLEEFLEECNRQNMIPFVSTNAPGAIAMADKYMGHYNYICYGGNRTTCPYGIIFTWNASSTSKEQILATCDAIGSPMIYGLGNPQDFTDAELLEIVEALHARGYAISTSYQDANWAKYRAMGFDFNGSQRMINRIDDGNLCNYSSIFGWGDYDLTGNPANNDDVLTFESVGTITPKLGADTYPVCGYDVEIVFDGSIDIISNATGGTMTYTSDGSSPVYCVFPVFDNSPNIVINVSANTTVYDLYFKAKRFY